MRDPRSLRLAITTVRILEALLVDTDKEFSGAEIWAETKVSPRYRYPILMRLEEIGWLSSRWEKLVSDKRSRPRRRYYKLTPEGHAKANAMVGKTSDTAGLLAWSPLSGS